MTDKQYRTANGRIYPVIMIILCYFLLIFAAAIIAGSASSRVIVQIIFVIAAIAGSTFTFVKCRDKKACSVTTLGSCAAAYVVIILLNSTDGIFMYAFAILIISMAFLNMKLTIGGNAVTIIGNLLRIVIHWQNDSATQTAAFVELFTLALVAIASVTVTKLLIYFNTENTNSILSAAKEQEKTAELMAEVANDLSAQFSDAMRMVAQLKECVDTGNLAMSNIADSTENTADAIRQQASMCAQIQETSDTAAQEIQAMLDASDRTLNTITDSFTEIRALQGQAANVSNASGAMVEVVEQLTGQVTQVEQFISTILNIASQTNLLALNASIEAARAGEAGKGFAVVAEEIRNLSEQTQEASNKITSIIKELNAGTQKVNESIGYSVDSVQKQNAMIENTLDRFNTISSEMELLSNQVKNTEKSMASILSSTNTISDNINQLSAASEEVAASSNEGLRTSESSVENMNACKQILENISVLADKLRECCG